MVRLHLLGSLGLRAADGREILSLLAQPRRTALLAYLAAARPYGFHRRDTLFSLFWPESDTGRARNALNQALHRLRQALGEGVVISRGDGEVGLHPGALWCDASAFGAALDRKDIKGALALYRGDLLRGFFLADAPELESWIEAERSHLRNRAVRALLSLAAVEEAEGRFRDAAEWYRRALELAPDDEAALCRRLRLLDRISERGAALRAYEDFARWLHREYGLEPTPETRALLEEIRSRSERAERSDGALPTELPPGRPPAGEGGRGGRPIRSLAVLPFVDLSPGKEHDFLGCGIAEELMTALARVPGLRVPARTSAFAFHGRETDVREIGWRLGVETVLEGSLRVSAGRLRITARLVAAADGFRVWSETYDRELRDALEVQQEIAQSIAHALQGRIGGERATPRAGEESREAYHLYLKGRYFKEKRTEEGLRKAIACFRQVIGESPRHARAHAALADAYQLQVSYGRAPASAARGKARAAVMDALAIDDGLAEAHASYAGILSWEGDALGAEREYRRAIELDPGYAQAHQWYASFLRHRGRLDEALREAEIAMQLDPLSLSVMLTVGSIFRALRHYDLAIEQYQRVLEMDPTYAPALYWLSGVYALTGQGDRAVAAAEQALAAGGEGGLYLSALVYAQALAGRRADAERTRRRLEQLAEREPVAPVDLALAHIGMGERNRALAHLERACLKGDPSVRELRVDPYFDCLRTEPRFRTLLALAKLSDGSSEASDPRVASIPAGERIVSSGWIRPDHLPDSA